MKKLLSLILALILAFSCIGICPVVAENDLELVNSLYKLQNATDGETPTFKVGYFGGSVTSGVGATSEDYSWRGITRDWIKTNFPDADVTEVNAAIGATGSIYGLYRAERHLIKEKAPDLCFIEYAINDSYGYDAIEGNTIHNNYSNLESIIRKIYASNPYADIVLVVTGDHNTLKAEATSNAPVFGTTHTKLAEYYDLTVIYVGRELAKTVYAENGNVWPATVSDTVWAKYFTDNVHPTDAGYEIYGETVVDYLEAQLLTDTVPSAEEYINKTESASYPQATFCETNGYGDLYLDADMVSPNALNPENIGGFVWNYENSNLLSYSFSSKAQGDSVTLEFNSSNLGIWTTGYPDGTSISWSIDGGTAKSATVKRGYLSEFLMLAEGLDNSVKHTITITHNDNNRLNIRFFMMSGMPEGEEACLKAIKGAGGESINPDGTIEDGTVEDGTAEENKTMLHMGYHNESSSTMYDEFGIATKGKLEAGDYVVSFAHKGYNNVTAFFIRGMDWRVNMWANFTTHHTSSQPYAPSANLLTNTGSSPYVEYKFTLTEEQAAFNYQVFCFYLAKGSGTKFDFYLTDFKVYKADDATKTNLLYSGDNPTNLTGWATPTCTDAAVANYRNLTAFEYVPYDSSLFNKTVLHIGYHNQKSSMQYDEMGLATRGKLEAGDYVVSYYSNSARSYINVFIIRGMNSRANMYQNYTPTHTTNTAVSSGTMLTNTGWGNRTEYRFTLTEEQAAFNYHIFTFYFSQDSGVKFDLFIDDFVVYKADDPTKTNLLASSDYKADLTGWASYSYTGANVAKIPQLTAFEYVAYGSGDANCDTVIDIRDLVRIKKDLAASSVPFNPLADFDDNSVLNSLDVTAMRKRIMELS